MLPAPPGPLEGEIPPRATGSDPCPVPAFAPPPPFPLRPLPGPFPRKIAAPPPEPPNPGFSPPLGDIASEPVLPFVGTPTFVPGCVEITAPALEPAPPVCAGAEGAPASMGPPRPAPRWPEPVPVSLEPPPIEGGGGTTLLASSVPPSTPFAPGVVPVPPPAPDKDGGGGTTFGEPIWGADHRDADPVPLGAPTDGGGATTSPPNEALVPLRTPRGFPAAPLTAGGGATTLLANVAERPLLLAEVADGGGGTISLGPKILPIMLLMNDPLPDCEGGGGTTFLPASGSLFALNRRISRDISVDGGGATTDGAGNVAFEVRALAFSGAETGGGITAGFIACRGALVIWRATEPGAGGIMPVASPGPERA